MTNDVSKYLSLITAELKRQHKLWGDQSGLPEYPAGITVQEVVNADADEANYFKRLAARSGYKANWRDILLEEVYEALAETEPSKKVIELMQVAAVCVNEAMAIERRSK